MLFAELSEPRVAIIDDVEAEAQPIREALERKAIRAEFFDASPEVMREAEQPIQSIELIFLDLYYGPGLSFRPDACAQIIMSIVPPGKQYILVVWSRDPDNAEEVVDVLRELNLQPIKTITKNKGEFFLGEGRYDIDKLFAEIDFEVTSITDVVIFDGEIIEIEDDSVIVDCLIDKEHKKFQLRRFDRRPLESIVNLVEGNYLTITITTKPGSTTFEFSNAVGELKQAFSKDDYMQGIDESIFKGE